jgi:hypothetical protein
VAAIVGLSGVALTALESGLTVVSGSYFEVVAVSAWGGLLGFVVWAFTWSSLRVWALGRPATERVRILMFLVFAWGAIGWATFDHAPGAIRRLTRFTIFRSAPSLVAPVGCLTSAAVAWWNATPQWRAAKLAPLVAFVALFGVVLAGGGAGPLLMLWDGLV